MSPATEDVTTAPRAVLALGDFGHERCGVGGSAAAVVAGRDDIEVLDTVAPGLRRFYRAARRAAASGAIGIGVYPTRSTVYQRDLLVRALLLRLAFGRRRFRLHLHEYRNLRRMLRWPATLALLLPHRVIVSSVSERDAVSGALWGLVGRRCEVLVAIPTNGTVPDDDAERAVELLPEGSRTVGVFGMYRDDKDPQWLHDVLERLDDRFDRLVLAGAGWEDKSWPAAVTERFEVVAVGHVPRRALPDLFASWGLAVAPLLQPAHDGRMSVRTPLAFGVSTVTVGPRGPDLTLAANHLVLVPPAEPQSVTVELDRRAAAREMAQFERAAVDALTEALFG